MKNKKTIISSIITMACVLCILGISLYFVLRKNRYSAYRIKWYTDKVN